MDNSSLVSDARIKKLISEYRKCPFFFVNIETGENVEEVFNAGEYLFHFYIAFNANI